MKSIKLALLSFLVAAAGVPALAPAVAQAADEIVYVDFDQFYRDSKLVSATRDSIIVEFRERDSELKTLADNFRALQEELEKEDLALSDEVKAQKQQELETLDRELARKGRALAEDRNIRFQERRVKIDEEVERIIQILAEENDYAMVLNPYIILPFGNDRTITHNIVLYAKDAANITEQVTARFDKEAKIDN